MSEIHRQAILPFSAEQMFDLVLDVRRYPDFLPFCSAVEIVSEGDRQLEARMILQKAGVRQSLTTRNLLERPAEGGKGLIRLELVDGPLRQFQGEWRFTQLADAGCKVELYLVYEVQAGLVGRVMAGLIRPLASRMVDVFCSRANYIYGS